MSYFRALQTMGDKLIKELIYQTYPSSFEMEFVQYSKTLVIYDSIGVYLSKFLTLTNY